MAKYGKNRSDKDREKYHRITKEYAQEILLLSKYDYFIGMVGVQPAMGLSINGGRFKDIKVLEDGNHIESMVGILDKAQDAVKKALGTGNHEIALPLLELCQGWRFRSVV